MKLALLYRSCSRQVGRAAVLLPRRRNGTGSTTTYRSQLPFLPKSVTALPVMAFSTHVPSFFAEHSSTTIDVAPVMEDALEGDIADNEHEFSYYNDDEAERVAVRRIMSPTEASFSVVEEETSHFDQDYDQYTLHMSTFQAYNSTHEYLAPGELGILDPEDCVDLEEVEHHWEAHPDAYTDSLPPASSVVSTEFAPDVEDI